MYNSYLQFLSGIRSATEPFKRHPDYTAILEHVSASQGQQYYSAIKGEFGISDERILAFCSINDSFGDPLRCKIGNLTAEVSPTSLRYIYHASLILDHLKKFPEIDTLVEVGGGYGGLYLALHWLAPPSRIREYHIVDLDFALNLQKLVLSHCQEHTASNIIFHSSHTFGYAVPENSFFVSNYCYSEIDSGLRQTYKNILLPKCPHGFILWNMSAYDPIDKPEVVRMPERPYLGFPNEFVYF
jgi:hypothetical protein